MPKVAIGNFKCNGLASGWEGYLTALNSARQAKALHPESGWALPYLHLARVSPPTFGGATAALWSQNVAQVEKGAFTGEISIAMLQDIGVSRVLVGHSERRHVFGESDENCWGKVKIAQAAGARVVFCVGEKLEERESGRTLDVVSRQLADLPRL